jgi:predicted phage baseplate assembly protein
MAAVGGLDLETIEDVRQRAPFAFREQLRAVTPEDYARAAERHRSVQRAVTQTRWTGSWRTLFLSVDRVGGESVDAAFEAELRQHLERYRLAGHDLEIVPPRYAFLDVEIRICVAPEYFRADVHAALKDTFASGRRAGGERGVFHPDNFTFGQPVHVSPIVAAAQATDGVRFAAITRLQRLGGRDEGALEHGRLSVGPLEVARLDNNASFPEHGKLTFAVEGGR